MTFVDFAIIGFALLMAIGGYSRGLIVGALSLLGFAGGALLGSRVGPLVLSEGSRSPYAPLVTLVAALAVGGLLAAIAETVGYRLRGRLGERLGALDGVAGAALLGAVAFLVAWIAGAAALLTPGAGEVRREIQRSEILQALNSELPPSGALLNALARFDPFPRLDAPRPDLAPPPPGIARDADVEAAGASVVRVLGTACGLSVQGSGWIAGDGIVVTNAHVVAGQDDTTVQIGGEGPTHDAEAIHYDPRNDLAILSSSGASGAPALELNDAADPGSPAAILGFPLDGGYDVQPGRVGETISARTQDAYGRGPIERRITQLRGTVRSGNSGGPMVDGSGRVVTTIFAATVGDGGGAGYGVPDSIVAEALEGPSEPVDTGPCAA
ncbi:MAG: MarP family serine protease [Thermoleophilaceae bacterium]